MPGVDYEMAPTLALDRPEQLQAVGHELRTEILALLSERAATTKQLAQTLQRPVGTVGHHLKVLERAGLITVVRTRKVRAITEKYFGRTAATFIIDAEGADKHDPDAVIERVRREVIHDPDAGLVAAGTVRYARIPAERVDEWLQRLGALGAEFATQPADGDVVWGLALTVFPTARRSLPPDPEGADT